MPVNKEMMMEMQKKYGKEKGMRVYFAVEQKRKKSVKTKKK